MELQILDALKMLHITPPGLPLHMWARLYCPPPTPEAAACLAVLCLCHGQRIHGGKKKFLSKRKSFIAAHVSILCRTCHVPFCRLRLGSGGEPALCDTVASTPSLCDVRGNALPAASVLVLAATSRSRDTFVCSDVCAYHCK